MMGLQDASRFVEYMPDDQLAKEVQAQTIVPSYVALAEVARRNDMRNSQQNPPQPTVAESEVSQLMGSAGISSNQPLSSPMGESPVGGDVPASSGLEGMQMMAEGGITGYNEGGRSFMEKALDFRDPDGTINWTKSIGTGLTALSLLSPVGLGARGIYGAVRYGLPALFKKGASLYNRKISEPIGIAAFKAMSPKMRADYLKRMTGEGGKFAGKKSVPTSVLGNIVQKRAGLAGGLGATAYASGLEDGDINQMEGMDATGNVGEQSAGLSGDNVSGTDEASMPSLLMAQLGFGLMGARNTTELAKNINSAISEYSARERQEKIDKSEAEERKARTAYYQAQAEGNTEQSIINEVNAINKALESGAMVESPELKMHIASLLEQLSLMRGDLGMGAKNKKNPVEEARVG